MSAAFSHTRDIFPRSKGVVCLPKHPSQTAGCGSLLSLLFVCVEGAPVCATPRVLLVPGLATTRHS
jgi:hypothetical protein